MSNEPPSKHEAPMARTLAGGSTPARRVAAGISKAGKKKNKLNLSAKETKTKIEKIREDTTRIMFNAGRLPMEQKYGMIPGGSLAE